MNVRRTGVGIVQRPGAQESDARTGARIVTPQRDIAFWAAQDCLAFATFRRRINGERLAPAQLDAVGFHHRVDDERRAGLALTPTAMTTMNEKRRTR